MKRNFHLLFYLRKQKNYKSGPVAIYMRITICFDLVKAS